MAATLSPIMLCSNISCSRWSPTDAEPRPHAAREFRAPCAYTPATTEGPLAIAGSGIPFGWSNPGGRVKRLGPLGLRFFWSVVDGVGVAVEVVVVVAGVLGGACWPPLPQPDISKPIKTREPAPATAARRRPPTRPRIFDRTIGRTKDCTMPLMMSPAKGNYAPQIRGQSHLRRLSETYVPSSPCRRSSCRQTLRGRRQPRFVRPGRAI